jgi:hypothetical protein
VPTMKSSKINCVDGDEVDAARRCLRKFTSAAERLRSCATLLVFNGFNQPDALSVDTTYSSTLPLVAWKK